MTKKILIVKHYSCVEDIVVVGQFTTKQLAQAYLKKMAIAGAGDLQGQDELYNDEDSYRVMEIDFATIALDPEPNLEDYQD